MAISLSVNVRAPKMTGRVLQNAYDRGNNEGASGSSGQETGSNFAVSLAWGIWLQSVE